MSEANASVFTLASIEEVGACLSGMGGVQCEMDGLSELDHALQCAAVLKDMAPQDVELQIAGLLHDIGAAHGSERDHGRVGGLAVRGLFGERISQLVRLHVDAKRYLVSSDPAYRARLSPVSLTTLARQGGLMDRAEIAAFQSSPYHDDAIRLRGADDLAKSPGKATGGLDAWLMVLKNVRRSDR